MKDCQKVYIKGNPSRGAEVIKALTDLGGINHNDLDGKGKNTYYYISPLGIIIGVASYEKNMISILKEFYTEISIERWKPKYKEHFYRITWSVAVIEDICYSSRDAELYSKVGNCFKTKEEAEAAIDNIKKNIKEILKKQ